MNLTNLPDGFPVPIHPRSDRCQGTALGQTLLIVVIVLVGLATGMFILRSGGTAPTSATQDEHEEKGAHAAKDRVELTPEKLKNARLRIESVESAKIHLNLRVFGKVVPDEEKLAHVSPRFAGVVRKVNKRLGESVNAGEVLATVESNESLQSYDLKAPLGGTIIEREATVGEYVGTDKSLFTVADLSTVWVDFQVYQQDFPKLRTGQAVRIASGARGPVAVSAETPPPLVEATAAAHPPAESETAGNTVHGRIDYLSPFGAETTQTMLARSHVPSPNGALRPGWFVSGEIAVDEINAAVAVAEDAVHTLDGKDVVFIEEGDHFVARTVRIGQRDGEQAEVLSGLKPGERYVAVNSFILKAEIGKEGAEHED